MKPFWFVKLYQNFIKINLLFKFINLAIFYFKYFNKNKIKKLYYIFSLSYNFKIKININNYIYNK
jgi:hypothetical protein